MDTETLREAFEKKDKLTTVLSGLAEKSKRGASRKSRIVELRIQGMKQKSRGA
jgi:hypothetical protein